MTGGGVNTEVLAPKEIDASAVAVANASANVSISNVAPAAVGTATISKWIKVVIGGVDYYIPAWT
jgi:hypothetical protein|tara:strand:+ start:586 stop:780 length:195 start_codon:yes stop_codon:yes gene_type:complete